MSDVLAPKGALAVDKQASESREPVTLLGIRHWSRRLHRQGTGCLLAVALAGMIALHHGGTGVAHVEHDGMTAVVALCFGAFTAVGTPIAAVTLGVLALGRGRHNSVGFPAAGSRWLRRGHRARAPGHGCFPSSACGDVDGPAADLIRGRRR